jgi:hypothetical protein
MMKLLVGALLAASVLGMEVSVTSSLSFDAAEAKNRPVSKAILSDLNRFFSIVQLLICLPEMQFSLNNNYIEWSSTFFHKGTGEYPKSVARDSRIPDCIIPDCRCN